MSYEEFANKPSVSSGDALDPTTQINNPAQGSQDEFELRAGDTLLDGVASGMVCTIDAGDDEIDIAAGRAYVAGKRYSGAASVAFVAQATDTYFIYIDSTDDTTPYKAKTTAPTSGEITLCTVLWTLGTTTLSALDDDVKVLGNVAADMAIPIPGTLSTGVKLSIPIVRDLWIESVTLGLANNGAASGATTVDLNLGADGASGTSIFGGGNEPSIAYDAAEFTQDEVTTFTGDRKPDAGEHLDVEIDAVPGTASEGMTLTIKARER